MTPEERAQQVLNGLGEPHEYDGYVSIEVGRSTLLERLTAALRAAAAEEREACATVAAGHAQTYNGQQVRRQIAAAIRARA